MEWVVFLSALFQPRLLQLLWLLQMVLESLVRMVLQCEMVVEKVLHSVQEG